MMIPRFQQVQAYQSGDPTTQTTDIFNGSIKAYFLGNGINQVTGQKNISWDASKWTLSSAILNVSAQSNAGNGARLDCYIGGIDVVTLNWAIFDVSTKSASSGNIAPYIINGANDWIVQYEVAFLPPPGSPDTVTVSSSLVLTFDYIGSGVPPSGPPANTQPTYLGLTLTQILEILAASLAGLALVGVVVKVA